jgi:uncharacterized membrane protein
MQVKTCEVCGKRAARYICQECGRDVCQFCFESTAWVCLDCYKSISRQASPLGSFGWSTPFKLFLLGFVLMFAGIIVIMIATVLFGASTDAGAIIWVFPLPPIGFGTGPYAFWAVLLGVALTVLGLILFIVLRKRAR